MRHRRAKGQASPSLAFRRRMEAADLPEVFSDRRLLCWRSGKDKSANKRLQDHAHISVTTAAAFIIRTATVFSSVCAATVRLATTAKVVILRVVAHACKLHLAATVFTSAFAIVHRLSCRTRLAVQGSSVSRPSQHSRPTNGVCALRADTALDDFRGTKL